MKLSDLLLRKAQNDTIAKNSSHRDLRRAFRERYGVEYSDIKDDELVDAIDYFGVDIGGNYLTVEKCDEIMKRNGYPPKEKK